MSYSTKQLENGNWIVLNEDGVAITIEISDQAIALEICVDFNKMEEGDYSPLF